MCYLSLKNACFRFPFCFLLPDPVEGVLPLLERLFGVKGHDCFLSFGFHADMISTGNNLFCEGWLWYVLRVVYNFRRLRLFCRIVSYIDTSEVER